GAHRRGPDLRAARRPAPSEVSLRSTVHPPPVVRPRPATHRAVVLDHVPRHVGSERAQVLKPYDAVLREGHYATKQIFCRARLIPWSHQRRFETGLRLALRFGGLRVIDYGCGDGTFLALLSSGPHPPALSVGAELDPFQVDECQRRLGGRPGLQFESIA